MQHLGSRKTGNSAEHNLMDMLKGQKNKHRYVSIKLSDFSKIMHSIVRNNLHDVKLTKYLLRLHREANVRSLEQSTLVGDEATHLVNAIKARYMTVVRKLKLPLNTGKDKL